MVILCFVSNWRNLDGWEENEKLENGSNGLSLLKKKKKSFQWQYCQIKKKISWNPKDFVVVTKTRASPGRSDQHLHANISKSTSFSNMNHTH